MISPFTAVRGLTEISTVEPGVAALANGTPTEVIS